MSSPESSDHASTADKRKDEESKKEMKQKPTRKLKGYPWIPLTYRKAQGSLWQEDVPEHTLPTDQIESLFEKMDPQPKKTEASIS